MTHGKPCPPIEGSRRFLVSYLNSLLLIKQFPAADFVKGNMVLSPESGFNKQGTHADGRQKVRKKWELPGPGEVKLNIDGAFSSTGAGIGLLLRDDKGEVIFAACQKLQQCQDATEAEIKAIEEGLRLALHWSTLNITVESDCAEAVELIKESTPNTSAYAFSINVIREFLREREIKIAKISRDVNVASHELAKLGRVHGRTEVWFSSHPPEIAEALSNDCNPMFA
jgi:ribonuclease HI